MSDTIATTTDGQYRVVATADHDAESPRWGAEVGSMFCEHPRYDLGDKRVGVLAEVHDVLAEEGPQAAVQYLREKHGVTCILPLFLHDHSGLSMTAGANLLTGDGEVDLANLPVPGWDTSLVGAIFATAESWAGAEILGDVEDVLRAEVKEYDAYLRGDSYLLTVERKAVRVLRATNTYADGTTEETVTTAEVWVPVLDDESAITILGSDEHQQVAAEMLHKFEAHVSNV